MRDSDLADYLDNDPFQEPSEPRSKAAAKPDDMSEPKPLVPGAPDKPRRSETFERDKHESDVLRMVMEVFLGARWTTREEYRRLAHHRDRKGQEKAMNDFIVKDGGQRHAFESGMLRDTAEGKIDYTLVLDGPMFERWAEHMTKGAKKYSARNWMQASGQAEFDRFRESALRHFIQWFRGETEEDHGSAVLFNINGAEFVREKMRGQSAEVG